jgi:hypothetical protein
MLSKDEVTSKPLARTRANAKPTRDHLIDVGLELMRRHGYGATGSLLPFSSATSPWKQNTAARFSVTPARRRSGGCGATSKT